MEWMKLAVELAGHVAWPLAIVCVVLVFRQRILSLLDPESVESVEAGTSGVKLTRRKIDAELDEARSAIDKDTPTAAPRPDETDHMRRMRDIASIDPPAATFASAAHFESVLRSRLQGDDGPFRPLSQLIKQARDDQVLSPEQADGALRLNHIRNEIAHEYGRVQMSESQAIEFCELAWRLEQAVS